MTTPDRKQHPSDRAPMLLMGANHEKDAEGRSTIGIEDHREFPVGKYRRIYVRQDVVDQAEALLHTLAEPPAGLNGLALTCAMNSLRWFPHLHDPEITSDAERLKHMALGLTEEAGEAAGIVKKSTGYLAGQAKHSTGDGLAHELVDVLVYLLNIAHDQGIDMDVALAEKTAICEARWGTS